MTMKNECLFLFLLCAVQCSEQEGWCLFIYTGRLDFLAAIELQSRENNSLCCILFCVCVLSVVGTVVLVPAALGFVGFTAGGITAGSVAAGMMSSAALANGGGVAAGSLVAVLQSVGEWTNQQIWDLGFTGIQIVQATEQQ